jgi:hypothetical protein
MCWVQNIFDSLISHKSFTSCDVYNKENSLNKCFEEKNVSFILTSCLINVKCYGIFCLNREINEILEML